MARTGKILLRAVAPLVALAGICVFAAAAPDGEAYRASVEKWRQEYQADLTSDHGWLSVSGLFWLHDGENSFGSNPLDDIVLPAPVPAEAGSFEFHNGKTVVHMKAGVEATMHGAKVTTAEMKPDSDDRLVMGDLTLYVHASGERYAIRLKDKNGKLRKNFTGLHWFPIDPSYRVVGHFVPYAKPKTEMIENVMGDVVPEVIPGYVEFTLKGQKLRLESELDGSDFEFVFRDLTSGHETYGAARFLDTELAKDGSVVMDFNEAYNPPCAYNPYTTCPLPPPQNRLAVRIEAGEKAYHH
jgi:uncharacterized protein